MFNGSLDFHKMLMSVILGEKGNMRDLLIKWNRVRDIHQVLQRAMIQDFSRVILGMFNLNLVGIILIHSFLILRVTV